MKNWLFIIAIVAFYIAAIFFFIDGNNMAGAINLFSGTVFLFVAIKKLREKS